MTPRRVTQLKEATKTALAFAIVYGIALQADWMSPSWAGVAVAMIALPTAGQSIHKGALRLAGTIPGCLAGLAILSLASQSRWDFICLVGAWVFFCTYMMLADKKRAYLWNVAGFVCLIIALSAGGASSSADLFASAVFRTLETVLGIVVYTLVTVFLWPRTNAGALAAAGAALVGTQAELCRAGRNLLAGRRITDELQPLHTREVQQLSQLAQVIGTW